MVTDKSYSLQVMTYADSLWSESLFWTPFDKPQHEIKLTVGSLSQGECAHATGIYSILNCVIRTSGFCNH